MKDDITIVFSIHFGSDKNCRPILRRWGLCMTGAGGIFAPCIGVRLPHGEPLHTSACRSRRSGGSGSLLRMDKGGRRPSLVTHLDAAGPCPHRTRAIICWLPYWRRTASLSRKRGQASSSWLAAPPRSASERLQWTTWQGPAHHSKRDCRYLAVSGDQPSRTDFATVAAALRGWSEAQA